MDISNKDIPFIDIPLHTLIELTPNTYNFTENYIKILKKCIYIYMILHELSDLTPVLFILIATILTNFVGDTLGYENS